MKKSEPRKIELLAPARNADIAITAIRHGADAVYIGSEGFGARAAAGNSVDDIKRVVEYARKFHAKVYVTFNTLIYENEIKEAENLIKRLYYAGVDALIVQDLALLEMDIPPIQLHASTQTDARTPEKAGFLEQAGFSQIVIPREMTLAEIRKVAEKVKVPLEAFVHGALCVSYSGACKASFLANGRSANRGECAQMCRQSYTLEDEKGKEIISGKHLLSLKDMNRMEYLSQMMDAGISSFKIEGRLKDEAYIKNVVGAYRKAIDRIIDANPEKYCRASLGRVHFSFNPDVSAAFNRGFTTYFIDNPKMSGIASFDTPKSIGVPVGRIVSVRGKAVTVKTGVPVSNGDGLGFFTSGGEFRGFRANSVEGNVIRLREPLGFVKPGTVLYRNRDVHRDAELAKKDTANRLIDIDCEIRLTPDGRLSAEFTSGNGLSAEATVKAEILEAKNPVLPEARRSVMSKLGDTVFFMRNFSDKISENRFIPNSILASLRREAVAAMEREIEAKRPLSLPAPRTLIPGTAEEKLAENVANSIAKGFYTRMGVTEIISAAEVLTKPELTKADFPVMECRYCLRRELGACLRKKEEMKKLPSPLYIRTGNIRYRLDFYCDKCEMKVVANPK